MALPRPAGRSRPLAHTTPTALTVTVPGAFEGAYGMVRSTADRGIPTAICSCPVPERDPFADFGEGRRASTDSYVRNRAACTPGPARSRAALPRHPRPVKQAVACASQRTQMADVRGNVSHDAWLRVETARRWC
jgi:hypothetical protein